MSSAMYVHSWPISHPGYLYRPKYFAEELQEHCVGGHEHVILASSGEGCVPAIKIFSYRIFSSVAVYKRHCLRNQSDQLETKPKPLQHQNKTILFWGQWFLTKFLIAHRWEIALWQFLISCCIQNGYHAKALMDLFEKLGVRFWAPYGKPFKRLWKAS